jgi:hypothetical protein
MSSRKQIIEKRKRRRKKGEKKRKGDNQFANLSMSDFSPDMAFYFNFAN